MPEEDPPGDEAPEYTNEDCPEGCSTEHGPPTPDGYGQWACSGTGTLYNRCDACDDWEEARSFRTPPTLIGDDWFCDPYNHEMYRCDDCSEWLHCDDTCSDDYGEGIWCESCYDERRHDDDDYTSTSSSARGEPVYTCNTCNTLSIYFDEMSEKFVCKCVADALKAKRSPFKLVTAR